MGSRAAGTQAGESWWKAFAGVAAGWLALHGLGLLGPLAEGTLVVIGLSTIIAAVVGVRSNRVERPAPWNLLIAGMVIWLVGGALRVEMDTLGNLTSSRSLVPDAFSMTGYVLAGFGLAIVHHRRFSDRATNIDAGLDAVITAIAVASVAWVAILVPAFAADAPSTTVEMLLVAYPVLTVGLATIVLRFSFSASGDQLVTHRLMVASFGCVAVGDAFYMLLEIGLADLPETIIDVPYGLGYIALGAAFLHPSIVVADAPAEVSPSATGRFRIGTVGLALAAPAVITLLGGDLRPADRTVLGALGGALAVGAVWRMTRAIRAQNDTERRLTSAAIHDPLTSLPNRVFLQSHLGALPADGRFVGALFADVDRFKLINDGLGHTTGDTLLQAIAMRLRANAGRDDFVARVGGDEFVIVTRADDAAEVEDLAERLRCSLGVPFRVGTSEIHVSMSVGVRVVRPEAAADLATILEDADSALYQAKRRGRNTVVVFDQSMREWADNQLLIEQELVSAMGSDQLRVVYQPIVRLPDGVLEGFEALLRWKHPIIGDVSPSVFIPVAEENGLVVDLGAWVLDEACGQLATWRAQGVVGQVTMSVNLSPRQMIDRRIVGLTAETLERHELGPGALQLEITEGILTQDPITARRVLNELRDSGVRISLDDFGTGYSSLAKLKSFPIDTIKIDRGFIQGIGYAEPSSDESLVAAIVAMSRALGFRTIAEGVETSDQAACLFELGVRSAQGFHFASPVDPELMSETLAELRQQELR